MHKLGHYNQFGLMVGSVFHRLLQDLREEMWTASADNLENFMRERAEKWSSLPFPFGSEMPWDSTGQESVYIWTKHFGFFNASNLTLNAVLSYSPKIPSWGYLGNARRYFDFIVYGGTAPTGTERCLHHYGAPLNAVVALDAFRFGSCEH